MPEPDSKKTRGQNGDPDPDQTAPYRELVDLSPDFMAAVGLDGNFLHANQRAAYVCGYGTVEEMMKLNCFELIAPEDRGRAMLFFEEIIREEKPRIEEFSFVRKDGSRFPGEINATVAVNEKGQPESLIAVVRDISGRKLAESETSRQSEELAERNSELKALYEISQAATGAHDTGELISRVLGSVSELRHLFKARPEAGIFLIEGERMRLAGHTGGHSEQFVGLHDDMKIGDCLCGRGAETGEIIISESSRTDPRHHIHDPDQKDHGHIIVPLKVDNAILGVLYLYLPAGSVKISERRLNLLRSIGTRIATAIENVQLHEKTRELSLHDPLTGLANRRLMALELGKAMARSKRTASPFSVVMLDLDYFKAYNDHFGHASGDNLLVGLSDLIRNEIRQIDLGVRYGGEEFLIILPDTGMAEALEVAERIRAKTNATDFACTESMDTTGITVSLGVATWDAGIASEDILIARADTALYRAKTNGRNRVESWISTSPSTLINND